MECYKNNLATKNVFRKILKIWFPKIFVAGSLNQHPWLEAHCSIWRHNQTGGATNFSRKLFKLFLSLIVKHICRIVKLESVYKYIYILFTIYLSIISRNVFIYISSPLPCTTDCALVKFPEAQILGLEAKYNQLSLII